MAIISENIVEMRAEISLAENMVYIVKNGQIRQNRAADKWSW